MKQTSLEDFIELEEHTYQLEVQNKQLSKRIEEEIRKNREKDELMFHQSRFASMGEMIGNIAHQWRQPLMELSSLFINVEAQMKLTGKISGNEVLEAIQKSNEITKYMSSTINDFQNFFSKDKEKVCFRMSDQLNTTINIISSGIKENKIDVDIVVKKNPEICGYKNEYAQVLINIINNARDALIYRKIKNPKIIINVEEKNENAVVTIKDNAGGIQTEPLSKIFEPFFTLEKSNGTGVGLFMSKLIVENNMNGKLLVENDDDGALFTIIVPKVI